MKKVKFRAHAKLSGTIYDVRAIFFGNGPSEDVVQLSKLFGSTYKEEF